MQEYKYSVNCVLNKNKPQSMWNVNNPEYSVWSGTYEQNGQTFLLTNNSSTVAGVVIKLVNHLSTTHGMNYTWNNNVLTGSFKLTWNDGGTEGSMEMKNHSYHIMGSNYDKWSGNHSKMLAELAKESGCEDGNFELTYNTINGCTDVYSRGRVIQLPQFVTVVKKPVTKEVVKEEIIEEDVIGDMFNMFGDDDE